MGFLLELLLRLIFYFLLLPIIMVVLTPFILIGAVFSREGSYVTNVKNGYGTAYHYWEEALWFV